LRFATSSRSQGTIFTFSVALYGLTSNLVAAGAATRRGPAIPSVHLPPRPPTSARALPPSRQHRTGPPARNRRRVHQRSVLTVAGEPPSPLTSLPPPLSGAWARSVPSFRGPPGPIRPRRRAPALGWAEIFPPGPANREPFSFFFSPFLFLFSYIYAYIDILCTKNTLNKL
jgi:hypothetical protein